MRRTRQTGPPRAGNLPLPLIRMAIRDVELHVDPVGFSLQSLAEIAAVLEVYL